MFTFFLLNFFIVFLIVKLSQPLLYIFSLIYPKKVKSVLFLENFPIENAGYQYRAFKWCEMLNNNGFNTLVLTTNSHISKYDFKLINYHYWLIKCMWIKYFHIVKSIRYEKVIVRRELLLYNEYGNLFMEKLLISIHPDAILDFDDNIAAAKNEPRTIKGIIPKILMESSSKFTNTISLYKNFIVASSFLKDFVFNIKHDETNIHIIPTCVDYDKYKQKKYEVRKKCLSIGWIGGDQNYYLIDLIIPILNKLADVYDFQLIIIGGKKYSCESKFKIIFIPWNINNEIDNLYKIDIGIMPLITSEATKGKGGFKLIQYMGLGIVSIANRVTINEEIIDDKINSFLVDDLNQWEDCFKEIFTNNVDLFELGNNARKKILKDYTFTSNLENYIKILNK
jgi:glycosyltransferase involved in cell wall biosynthesis